jgi:hypothetical protein
MEESYTCLLRSHLCIYLFIAFVMADQQLLLLLLYTAQWWDISKQLTAGEADVCI